MPRRNHVAAMQLAPQMRAFLLRTSPPACELVYRRQVTSAYNVRESFMLPTGPHQILVYGHHRGPAADCLLVEVDQSLFRSDGRPYWITRSVAPGHSPAEAGLIDPGRVQMLGEGIEFEACARLIPRATLAPEVRIAV